MSDGNKALRAQLERTAVRDRDLDREIAADWFAVDREMWQRLDRSKKAGKKQFRPPMNADERHPSAFIGVHQRP
ncbi:MAG: hypothetical protein ABSH44_12065 [Bryobacteraceae bacterium]|jgi:hypothetical protein